MARRWHRRVRLPCVRFWIVAFHLTKHFLLALTVDDTALPAHGEEPVTIDDETVTGARRRQGCSDLPRIKLRTINMMQIGVVFECVETSAHHK